MAGFEAGSSHKIHQGSFSGSLRGIVRNLKQPVFIPMQQVTGLNRKSENLNRDTNPHDTVIRMAGDSTTGEIVESQRLDFRQITHARVADQPDSTQLLEDRGHHFAAVRGKVRAFSNLLEHDDGWLWRAECGLKKLDEGFFLFPASSADCFHLRGDGVPTHAT